MELAVKQAFAGETVRNKDAIANSEALDEIRRCIGEAGGIRNCNEDCKNKR